MWKKVAVTAAVGAAALGAGGAALAAPGGHPASAPVVSSAAASTSKPATPAAKNTGDKRHRAGLRIARLARLDHATWVTQVKSGAPVQHDAIHGVVAAVSGSSITVKAADGVSQTYTVGAKTKVRIRPAGKGKATAGSISGVTTGTHVLVVGTGTNPLNAVRILAGLRR